MLDKYILTVIEGVIKEQLKLEKPEGVVCAVAGMCIAKGQGDEKGRSASIIAIYARLKTRPPFSLKADAIHIKRDILTWL